MKHVIFTHHAFSSQRRGGVTRYFVELAKALTATGWRAEVFAGFHMNAHLRDASLNVTGWPVGGRRAQRLRHAVNDRLMNRFLDRRRGSVVVHETYYPFTAPRPRTGPVVITVHDMIHELHPRFMSAHDRTAEWKAAAVRRADHVICISHTTRNDLLQLHDIAEERVSVVYHGVSLPEAEPDPATPFRYLLYVGARAGYKYFDRLLRAFARVRASDGLFLVCFGGGSFTAAERQLMDQLGLAGRVHRRSGEDRLLAALYRGAEALVYPSLYEGFGLPVVEAMSLGCPVIASNGGALPEIAGAAAELFDPMDENSLIAALERTLGDADLRQRLRERGLERARAFSWERCARETAHIYESLGARRMPAPSSEAQ